MQLELRLRLLLRPQPDHYRGAHCHRDKPPARSLISGDAGTDRRAVAFSVAVAAVNAVCDPITRPTGADNVADASGRRLDCGAAAKQCGNNDADNRTDNNNGADLIGGKVSFMQIEFHCAHR